MGERLCLLTGKIIRDKPKRKNPEAKLGHAIDEYLQVRGAYVRTIKSDGTKTPAGWRRSAQGAGISDRIGVLPGGRFLAIEIKAPGKKPNLSLPQYNFLNRVLLNGGVAAVADSIEDVKNCLEQSPEELRSTLDKWKP